MQQRQDFMAASMCLGGSKDPSKELGAALVYNPLWIPVMDDDMLNEKLDGYKEASRLIKEIIKHFTNQKKVIGSWNIACTVIRKSFVNPVTDEDIMWAYAIGAGGGMEYEFPYE